MRRYLVIGMLAGWALWLTLIVAAYGIDASERFSPEWVRRADLPDTLGSVFMVAAWPVALGGWLFVWGDGPQPPSWVTGVPFNVGLGLVLYGALGLIAGAIYARRHKQE